MKKIYIIIMSLLVITTVGCKSDLKVGSSEVNKVKEEIYVSAAASLTESMTEIVDLYNTEIGDAEIILNFGSSGSLQRQIEQGAPTDVFVSASLAKIKVLEEGGFLENGYEELLNNEMVLIIPNESTNIVSFDDLKDDKSFIFAMGEPESVPAGKYASEVLDYLEISELLSEKVVFAKDVKEVLTWVEMGEADAGMVYATDAYVSKKVTIAQEAPENSHNPIIYPCAVIKDSNNKVIAESFVEFLKSEKATDIFKSYGF